MILVHNDEMDSNDLVSETLKQRIRSLGPTLVTTSTANGEKIAMELFKV